MIQGHFLIACLCALLVLPSIAVAQISSNTSSNTGPKQSVKGDRVTLTFDLGVTSTSLFTESSITMVPGSYSLVLLGKMTLPQGETLYFSKSIGFTETPGTSLEDFITSQLDETEDYLNNSWGAAANLVINRHGLMDFAALQEQGFENKDNFANYPGDSWFGEQSDPDGSQRLPPSLGTAEEDECNNDINNPSDDVQDLIDLIKQCSKKDGSSAAVGFMPSANEDGGDVNIMCVNCNDTTDIEPGKWIDSPRPGTCGLYHWDYDTILICTNEDCNGQSVDDILHHELIHAYQDQCRGNDFPKTCEGCMEHEYEAYKKGNNCNVDEDREPTVEECCEASLWSCNDQCAGNPDAVANCTANPPDVPLVP